MKRFLVSIFALCLIATGTNAGWQSRDSNYNINTGSVAYQGPGDVFSTSVQFWGSCARTYNAAVAAGTNMCDLVAVSTPSAGAAVCTLKSAANNFVDQSSASCNSTTPALACAAAGGCLISKVYDQSGNGSTHDVAQATQAQRPALVFSSPLSGSLPSIDCGTSNWALNSSATFSQAQPITLSAVIVRTAATILGGAVGGNSVGLIGSDANVNRAAVNAATTANGGLTATDGSWYALQGLLNGHSNSAINVNGTDAAGLDANTGSLSSTMRLCRAGGVQFEGHVIEAGIWFATSTSTDRGNLYTNQHGSSGYNGAF